MDIPIDKDLLKFIAVLLGLGIFLVIEFSKPYRIASIPKFKRWLANLSIAATNTIIVSPTMGWIQLAAAGIVPTEKWGLLNTSTIPVWFQVIFIFLVMDLWLYIWHILNHLVPFLWRFHRVHHSDLNMDVSTAHRFHPGEMTFSGLFKIGFILVLGTDIVHLLVFDLAVLFNTQFHHSSLKISEKIESFYQLIFVPPSMHRIHHSVLIKERNSNYGALFSFWDRIFRTFRKDIDQNKIRIGVGAYPDAEELKFLSLLKMPFTKPVR
jgi:sterol desaturase/sphingolipid hydroxylase (fatty acid hydroxylase superfamily)